MLLKITQDEKEEIYHNLLIKIGEVEEYHNKHYKPKIDLGVVKYDLVDQALNEVLSHLGIQVVTRVVTRVVEEG